jgi:hypothetical protein
MTVATDAVRVEIVSERERKVRVRRVGANNSTRGEFVHPTRRHLLAGG